MEKRKLLLLKYFLDYCKEGYKVLEINKICGSIKQYKGNFELLSSDVNFLSQHRYIDVKHIDKDNICVSVLDNSHILQDNIKSDRAINRKYLVSLFLNMLFSGFMAFVGAFLAVIILR